MKFLINGKKRAGKDYVATELKRQLQEGGYSSEIISFASPIKEIIAKTFNITLDELDTFKNNPDEFKAFNGIDFRQILQNFGTEAMKPQFGDAVWSDLHNIKYKNSNCDYVIVPDFRFETENYDYGFTINVFNNDLVHSDLHSSETQLDNFNFDFYIDNTGRPDISSQIKELLSAVSE